MSKGKTERLIGSDGKLVTVLFGTEMSGEQITESGWYKVKDKDENTGLPTDVPVGELVFLDDTTTLEAGDVVEKLEETEQGDITSFSLEIDRAEVDVTTLSDNVRRYRAGKVDMNGSLEGITTLGETDREGWVLNNFIRVVKQDGSNVDVSEVNDQPIYMKGYINKSVNGNTREAFVWARINLLSTSLGASGEDSQSFSSNFRVAPGDPDPTLYIREAS